MRFFLQNHVFFPGFPTSKGHIFANFWVTELNLKQLNSLFSSQSEMPKKSIILTSFASRQFSSDFVTFSFLCGIFEKAAFKKIVWWDILHHSSKRFSSIKVEENQRWEWKVKVVKFELQFLLRGWGLDENKRE